MNILEPLYTDIRQYIIAALELASDAPVVQGYQNGVPLPVNGIVMTFHEDGTIDKPSTRMDGDTMYIFNSVRGTMQVDFYGENAHDKARQIATLWNSPYTTSVLLDCVPLNNPRVRNLQYINEQQYYEPRFMIELELQYNTKYEKTVTILTDVTQIDLESIDAI